LEAHSVERKLAAIFAADVEGYSRLMGLDEVGTLRTLTAYRVIIDRLIASHRGRIFNTAGDSLVADFASAVDAVQCAVAVQDAIAKENADGGSGEMRFRIGVHVGDIIVQGDNLFGDAVNIAARLEALAEPGGICVSGTVRDHIGTKLPLSFTDLGEQQVKNIFQPIKAYRIRSETSPTTTPILSASLPLPDKPSIAVLPFANMSGDPEQEYFVDGVVEEIITAISRLPWLFVIGRNSSFAYKGKSPDLRQVGRELGVRYVLEGSVRKAGQRVRITGQLVDTTTGSHIWADHFDGTLDDISDLQDQVASSVAGAIEPKLRQSEIDRASRKPTESCDAYDLYLRALAEFHKLTAEGGDQALCLLRQALELDPSYAPAASLVGWCCVYQRAQGWGSPSDAEIEKSVSLAKGAIETGRDDPDALWMAGWTIGGVAGEHARAAEVIERALALNPNSAHAWMAKGWIGSYLDRSQVAMDAAQRAMRLSPLDPLGYLFKLTLARGHLLDGKYEEAMAWVDRSLREQPRFRPTILHKVALCGYLGRLEESREWVRRLLDQTIAGYIARTARFNSGRPRDLMVEGFRRAGVPEG
jgi:TolB-like protein/class 3 adenylate cyclase